MFELSLSALTYSFSCNFLWSILSLFLYLDENVTRGNIGKLGLKWGDLSEDLAHWAIDGWQFPLESDRISLEDKVALQPLIEGRLGDLLIFHFAGALDTIATDSHAIKPILNYSLWLYYFYCRFLWQVLKEFNQILQGLGGSSMYYKHYQKSSGLFRDLATALENERPFPDNQNGGDEDTRQAVWTEMDVFAARLGTEWHQAVLSAARDLKLPDFNNNTT